MKKIIFIILITLMFVSCSKLFKQKIDLPATKTPESINEIGVVKYQNSRLREESNEESKVVNYILQGKIVKIIKKENNIAKFENIENYWYFVDYNGEKGWIFGSYLEIFNDYNEAFKKSEEILLNKKKN